jgi:hypothetical protein
VEEDQTMRLILSLLMTALLSAVAFSAKQPSSLAPKDWHGVEFGSTRITAEKVIKEKFSNVHRSKGEDISTLGTMSVWNEETEVEFLFGQRSRTLCEVSFGLKQMPIDTVISRLTAIYGAPSLDKSSEFVTGPMRQVGWNWEDPHFTIGVISLTDVYGEHHLSVHYSAKDPSEP